MTIIIMNLVDRAGSHECASVVSPQAHPNLIVAALKEAISTSSALEIVVRRPL